MKNGRSQAKDIPDDTKLARLVQRGVIDGCACGCRGDFYITGKALGAS